MSFTKPYTYTTGNILGAADQNSNDDAVKKAVNQDTVAGDLKSDSYDFDSIESGELDPIVNHHHFMTGEDYGQSSGLDEVDRSYFTSHIRPSSQTGAGVVLWTPIFETGTTYELEETGDVLVNFGAAFTCTNNQIQVSGLWDSKVVMRYNDGSGWTDIEGTRAYTFEGARVSPLGTVSPTDVAIDTFGYPGSVQSELCVRRWIGFHWHVPALPAGNYQFAVFVNAKCEEGFVSARSFTAEIFYT